MLLACSVCHDDNAAMAAGNTSPPKGHLPQLQSSTKLHESSLEPKPSRIKEEKPNKKNEHKTCLFVARKLEENLGSHFMDFDNDWAFSLEVLSVQKQECIPCHGLLPCHG